MEFHGMSWNSFGNIVQLFSWMHGTGLIWYACLQTWNIPPDEWQSFNRDHIWTYDESVVLDPTNPCGFPCVFFHVRCHSNVTSQQDKKDCGREPSWDCDHQSTIWPYGLMVQKVCENEWIKQQTNGFIRLINGRCPIQHPGQPFWMVLKVACLSFTYNL